MKNLIMDTPPYAKGHSAGLKIQTRSYPIGSCRRLCTRLEGKVPELLVADPEDGSTYDENNDEENCPGIHMAVGLGNFRVVVTHCIASCQFLLVIADGAGGGRLTAAIARVKLTLPLTTSGVMSSR
ncbi:hypothetical protein [Pseudomonas sp. NFR16]|uniref:hypothetical protein n=1 Tax=Pseudomonas sp. NFR16 TaxID=1566248 RepID=UPI0015A6163A|nr:hypothetical protein [Pseudomonas sp. NFR16]